MVRELSRRFEEWLVYSDPNARSARRLLDEMVAKHARRIHQMENISEDDLVLLLHEDVSEVK
jgi:hypothetical protein